MRVVGCLRVKNGERWVKRWIDDMSRFCDSLCILDDGSTDATPTLLSSAAKERKNIFLHTQRGVPRDGGRDCNALYEMAGSLKADWIFAPDADEFIDPEDFSEIKSLVEHAREDVLGWAFPFFYFWDDEKHYRADGDYENCHVIRLFRFDPKLHPPKRASHSQLCPDELDRRRVRVAPARMVHYGYMDLSDRVAKHAYYTQRDQDPIQAGGGVKNYDHIVAEKAVVLKPYPTHKEWHNGTRTGWNIDVRLKRVDENDGPFFPGATDFYTSTMIDEAVVNADLKIGTIPALFSQMRSGGRIDVYSSIDFDAWVKEFSTADEPNKERLSGELDGKPLLWENRLYSVLKTVGFHRAERLTVAGLHVIAFKPDEEKKDK